MSLLPIIAKWIVAVHFSPPFEQEVAMLQPDPADFTFKNSQTPPAEETARREVEAVCRAS